MEIVYNNIIPPKGFKCINLFGILFVREGTSKVNSIDINHESIHTEQIKELGYIFFYIIYFFEWLFRVIFTKDRFSHMAYRHLSFEVEAYNNQYNHNYLQERKHYAQWGKQK